jgi:hypothetical protein
VDEIERVLDYVSMGASRFSNTVLQTLLVRDSHAQADLRVHSCVYTVAFKVELWSVCGPSVFYAMSLGPTAFLSSAAPAESHILRLNKSGYSHQPHFPFRVTSRCA